MHPSFGVIIEHASVYPSIYIQCFSNTIDSSISIHLQRFVLLLFTHQWVASSMQGKVNPLEAI